jgi:hypothetical protein
MRIRDPDPGWRQFGSEIRDGKKSYPGSGRNILDPPHCITVKSRYHFMILSLLRLFVFSQRKIEERSRQGVTKRCLWGLRVYKKYAYMV